MVCRTKRTTAYRAAGAAGRAKNAEYMRQWRLKNCDAEYWKKRYADSTPERRKSIKDSIEKNRRRNREYIDMIKRNACADCGKSYEPEAMDFDHVRGVKLFNVANMAGSARSLESIKEEVAKCDLVCAICHRLRTKVRRNLREEGK